MNIEFENSTCKYLQPLYIKGPLQPSPVPGDSSLQFLGEYVCPFLNGPSEGVHYLGGYDEL